MGFSSFLFPGFLLSSGNSNDSASGSVLFVCLFSYWVIVVLLQFFFFFFMVVCMEF